MEIKIRVVGRLAVAWLSGCGAASAGTDGDALSAPAEYAALHRRLAWYRPVAGVLVGLVLMKLGAL